MKIRLYVSAVQQFIFTSPKCGILPHFKKEKKNSLIRDTIPLSSLVFCLYLQIKRLAIRFLSFNHFSYAFTRELL